MTPMEFRKELIKTMPGFNWTVHKERFKTAEPPKHLCAIGIQTSGFNRLATLQVERWENKDGITRYEVKSAGYGKKTPWLSTATDGTLARALRNLQSHYEHMARTYGSQAWTLEHARGKAKEPSEYGAALQKVDQLNVALGKLAPKGTWLCEVLENIWRAASTEEATEIAMQAAPEIKKRGLWEGSRKEARIEQVQ